MKKNENGIIVTICTVIILIASILRRITGSGLFRALALLAAISLLAYIGWGIYKYLKYILRGDSSAAYSRPEIKFTNTSLDKRLMDKKDLEEIQAEAKKN